jgi:hypothetical protein
MPTIPHRPPTLDTGPVDAECWVTIAASKTTGTSSAPLAPARDPAGASPWRPVTWAGTCRTCRRPIWSSVWPGKGPKYCAADGGGPAMRLWTVSAGGSVTKPGPKGDIPGSSDSASADPLFMRGFKTGFVTPGIRQRARRGGRPRIYPVPAARQQAYRARQRAHLAPGAGAR